MATISAAGHSTEPAGSISDVRPSRLLRYRRWLSLRNEAVGNNSDSCPERYDAGIGLASPPSIAGDVLGEVPVSVEAEASGDMYQQTGTPLVQLMSGRWSGCLGPTVSNRSLSSRQGLRARTSVLGGRYCPVTAAAHMAAPANGAHSRVPSCSLDISPVVAHVVESDDECSQADVDMPLSPMSMAMSEPGARDAPHAQAPCGSWDCADCAGATALEIPGSGIHVTPDRISDAAAGGSHAMFIGARPAAAHEARPAAVCDAEYEPAAHQTQPAAAHSDEYEPAARRRYQAFNEEYLPEDSAYAEYATESYATDSVHEYGRAAGLAARVQAVGSSALQMDAPESVDGRSAIMHEMSAAQAGGAGLPSATAIAQIFLVGQPAQSRSAGRRVSRVRRASRRALLALSRTLRIGTRRLVFPALGEEGAWESLSALLETFSAEASLAGSIQVLEKTRNTRSPSFRMRADRVHASQAQLLLCIYTLFTQLVSAEGRRSRHYRFYLPEDDQMELDRGFSESVLFAAQALARGFQIRGTESHTDALREPAWMLCSVWAAVRFVLFARGGALWHAWTRGGSRAEPGSVGADVGDALSQDAIGALRRVLEDFDEAWVRFERELCFAYFGLNNSQVAGIMDPGDSSDSGQIAQEEEFSLLVVLLSETLQRCLLQGLVSEEQMEAMDPQLILALPRLAILHAVSGSGGGVDGLCFIESEGCPVFWWFREFADTCRQIHDVVGTWAPPLYELLQKMLVAEEADVVLAKTDDSVLADALFKDEPAPPKIRVKGRSETVRDDASSAKRTAVVDLESIIDSPRSARSARSLSIDDCISSFCASACLSPYEPCFSHSSRARASSSSCLACESSIRLYGNTLPGMFDVPPLPPHPSSTLLATPAELSASLLTSSSLQNNNNTTKSSLTHILSPSLSMASTRSVLFVERQRKMRLDACRKQLKQAFVSVCTVADSLHSGPFARPFRVALELVFRMNTTE